MTAADASPVLCNAAAGATA
ncbi:hypothetical protein Tco_0034983, partial [Tanacetum coccineum]